MLWFRITLHRSNALNLLYTGFTLCFTLWLFKKTPTILSTNQSKFNSFLRLIVVKPKPRYAQQSIRTRETPLGEITSEKVVVAFSFASDWSRGWRFSRPITDSKNAEESSSGLLSTLSCKFAFKAKGEWVSEFPALKVYFVFEFFCAYFVITLFPVLPFSRLPFQGFWFTTLKKCSVGCGNFVAFSV